MRAKKLVGRTRQEVAIQRLDINGLVWCILYRVHVTDGPDLVGELYRSSHVIDRAHGIGGVAKGDNPGARGDLELQVFHV